MSVPRSTSDWTRHRRSVVRAGLACWLALGLAACGAADEDRSSVPLEAARDGSLRFDRQSVRAAPGRVSIDMRNPSNIPHAVGLRGNGADVTGETVGIDATSSVEADLGAGVYELYCSIGGHDRAGMTARLTVR